MVMLRRAALCARVYVWEMLTVEVRGWVRVVRLCAGWANLARGHERGWQVVRGRSVARAIRGTEHRAIIGLLSTVPAI